MSKTIKILKEKIEIQSGSLCEFQENNLISIDNNKLLLDEYFSTKNCVTITDQEYQFLNSIKSEKRIKKFLKLKSFENLINNDKVLLKDNRSEWTITNTNLVDDKIFYNVKNNKEDKIIEPSNIKEISKYPINKIAHSLKCQLSNANFSEMKSNLSEMKPNKMFQSLRRSTLSDSFRSHQLKLIEDIYLNSLTKLKDFTETTNESMFITNDLVQIIDTEIFGRLYSTITNSAFGNISFAKILMNETIKKNLGHILDKILFSRKYFNGIIVNVGRLKKFDFGLISILNGIYIDENCIKYLEIYKSTIFEKGDFVKYRDRNDWKFLKVQGSCLINNEKCLEISKIFQNETKQSNHQFVKEMDMTKIHDIRMEISYYEGVVMRPYPIFTIDNYEKIKLKIGDKVKFTLRYKFKKINGIIQWTGKVNEIHTAILKLDKIPDCEILRLYKINKHLFKFFELGKYAELDELYLVPLCYLSKKNKAKEYCLIIKELLTNDNDDENVLDNILNKASNMGNENILPFLIENIHQDIQLKNHPDLLPLLFERKQFKTVELLLNKSIGDYSLDEILLNLAYSFFIMKQEILFQLCINKCMNKNTYLTKGETFLTMLLKSEAEDEILLTLLSKKYFDVNFPNECGEIPLSIVCVQLRSEIVGMLIKFYDFNTSTIDSIRAKVLKLNSKTATSGDRCKIIEIATILQSENKAAICIICRDVQVNQVFDCGHSACNVCANQITQCHICRTDITIRNKLFL